MTSSWPKQMGWNDVSVSVADASAGDWEIGPRMPRVLGLAGAAVRSIDPAALQARLAAGDAAVIDASGSALTNDSRRLADMRVCLDEERR